MKRSTWITLLFFIVAVGVFLYLKYRPAPKISTEDTNPTIQVTNRRSLFTDDSSTLTGIRIFDQQYHMIELERPSGGPWILTLPISASADQSKSEAAATQATALEILDTLNPSVTAGMVGLESPLYTIKLTFQTSEQHKLEIGDKTPVGDGYYVHYDDGPIYIIDANGIDAILNLLTTPPYLPTDTPVPAVTISTPTP